LKEGGLIKEGKLWKEGRKDIEGKEEERAGRLLKKGGVH
jgi:hypothetical protein